MGELWVIMFITLIFYMVKGMININNIIGINATPALHYVTLELKRKYLSFVKYLITGLSKIGMNSWSFKWKQSHPLNISNIYIYSCRDLNLLISSYVFLLLFFCGTAHLFYKRRIEYKTVSLKALAPQ